MIININGVFIDNVTQGGLMWMHNRSCETRFVYSNGKFLEMPHDLYWHIPVKPDSDLRFLTWQEAIALQAEIREQEKAKHRQKRRAFWKKVLTLGGIFGKPSDGGN